MRDRTREFFIYPPVEEDGGGERSGLDGEELAKHYDENIFVKRDTRSLFNAAFHHGGSSLLSSMIDRSCFPPVIDITLILPRVEPPFAFSLLPAAWPRGDF